MRYNITFKSLLFSTLVASAMSVSASTLFTETFDGGNRKTIGNDWQETERRTGEVSVKHEHAVLRGNARGAPDAAIERVFDGDFSNAVLSFDWKPLKKSDADDVLFVSIVSLDPLSAWQATNIFSSDLSGNKKDWRNVSVSLDAAPTDYPFILRFWTLLDGRGNRREGVALDNIIITSTDQIPTEVPLPPSASMFVAGALMVRRNGAFT